MSLKVAITGLTHAPESVITDAGMEVVRGPATTTEEFIDTLKECDGALISTQPLTARSPLTRHW